MNSPRLLLRLMFISALLTLSSITLSLTAFATTPVVTVTSPANGSQDKSPVNFTASASSPDCAAGIAAMRIYTAPGDGPYTTDSNHLDVNLNLAAGSYNTVVQAWDNCGGVGKTPVNITVSGNALPAPRFVYSSDFNDNKIYEYLVDASTGALTPTSQGSLVTASHPAQIASDQGGFRLYVANTGSEELSAYFINRDDGGLQAVPGVPGSLTGYPTAVVVHPSGDYVYVTTTLNAAPNYIYAFKVESNGSLSPVPGSPFASQYDPTAAVIDPAGSFLYVSTINASYTEAYAVDKSNGSLASVSGQPFPLVDQQSECSPGAEGLAFAQNGHHLVVPELCDGVITVYNVNSTNGKLTNASGSPVIDPQPASYQPVDLEAIAVDPLNRWWYLYETFPSELPGGDIATLTPKDVAERTGQQCGDIIRADPSGKFVYAIGNTTGDGECGASPGAILGFSVNQSNGTLTPLPGFPLASPNADYYGEDGLVVTR